MIDSKQALIIIDLQNDYFAGGKHPLVNPDQALNNALQLKDAFQEHQLPVIYIQHINPMADAPFFEQDTPGAELHEALNVDIHHDTIIEKNYPNSFYKTNLQDKLKELDIEQVVICGAMTHMCVDSTTRAAMELGYNPLLIEDATATCDLEHHGHTVKAQDVQDAYIAALSSFATVTTTQEYLAQ